MTLPHLNLSLLDSQEPSLLLEQLALVIPPPSWASSCLLSSSQCLHACLWRILHTRSARACCMLLAASNLCISHSSLSNKLGSCSCMMAHSLDLLLGLPAPDTMLSRQVVLLDATHTHCTEGTLRHHVALDLTSRLPLAINLSDTRTGETFKHFHPQPGSLWIGDRIYASWAGCSHVTGSGADFLVRYRRGAHLYTCHHRKERVNFEQLFDSLSPGEFVEVKVWGRKDYEGHQGPLRLLVKDMGAEFGRRELKHQKYSKGRQTEELKRFSRYLLLLSSSSQESGEQLLELYRGRWQIERYFKELKTLAQMEPPKELRKAGSAMGWARGFWVGEMLYQRWLGVQKLSKELRWKCLEQSWRVRKVMWPQFVAALVRLRQPSHVALESMLRAPLQLDTHSKASYFSRLHAAFPS